MLTASDNAALSAWSRLVQLQETRTDIVDSTEPPLAASAQPAHIAVKDLSIRIGDRAILDRVSFELAPGSVTAIVGRTGSGKSTLVEALCRLIAKATGVPPRDVALTAGATARIKRLVISGHGPTLIAALEKICQSR